MLDARKACSALPRSPQRLMVTCTLSLFTTEPSGAETSTTIAWVPEERFLGTFRLYWKVSVVAL